MDIELLKKVALIEELETSIRLIELGFGEYQNLDLKNDFYYLPFQLISSGLERLMKCHICLGHYEKYNVFPPSTLFKNTLKHDLLKLKSHIIENYFQTNEIPVLRDDLDFIKKDKELDKLVNLLSEFGKFARYYNLNLVTGETAPGIDIKAEWQAFEASLVIRDKNLIEKLKNIQTHKEVLDSSTRYIIIKLERFVGALARQFTIGKLGSLARQYSSIVYPFLTLMEDELGTRDYRKKTTKFKEKTNPLYKRTFFNKIGRITNQNSKSKKIKKSEFNGEWPFYTDEVIIECIDEHWCIITIADYVYALNGAAKGRYKLEDVHEAGMAILGKSVGPFIDLALKLGR